MSIVNDVKKELSEHLDNTIKAATKGAVTGATVTKNPAGAGKGAAVGIIEAAAEEMYKAGKEFIDLAIDQNIAQQKEHLAKVSEKAVEIKKQNPQKPVTDCYKEAEKDIGYNTFNSSTIL